MSRYKPFNRFTRALATIFAIEFCGLLISNGLHAADNLATSAHIKISDSPSVVSDVLESDERLSIFAAAFKQSDVWQHLEKSNLTLIAVTDDALRTEGSAFLLEIVLVKNENSDRLNQLMAHHLVANEAITAAEITKRESLNTMNDGCLLVEVSAGSVKIGPEAYVTESINVKNGTLYLVDRLLWQSSEIINDCVE